MLMLMLSFHAAVFAQNTGIVSGKVTDKLTGELLIGASIIVKGSSASAITNNSMEKTKRFRYAKYLAKSFDGSSCMYDVE